MSKPRSLADLTLKALAKPKAYFRMISRSGSNRIRSHCQDALETGLKFDHVHPSPHGVVGPSARLQ